MNTPRSKKYSIAAIFGITILLVISQSFQSLASSAGTPTQSATVAAPGNKAAPTDYAALLAKAQTRRVRLIVTLSATARPDSALSSPERVVQRTNIQVAQSRVLSSLPAATYNLIAAYQIFPIIALEADAQALTALNNSPEVVHIQEDIPEPPTDGASNNVIGAPGAWLIGDDGTGWIVAVLDTGIQTNHPFLAGKVIDGACFSTTLSGSDPSVTLCPNGHSTSGFNPAQVGVAAGVNCALSISDCKHGTHVAGIAAGKNYSGGPGFDGVARGAKLISIQVFSKFTAASSCGSAGAPCIMSYPTDQLAALQYVYTTLLPAHPQIASVNMSLGGGLSTTACDSDSRKLAIDNLVSANVATVIAAGNDAYSNAISYPACISSAVSVGATDNSDNITSFTNEASFMSLYAPGYQIRSSVAGSSYETWDGTSMSAPHVAGSWAILRQCAPNASVDTLLSALKNTGRGIRSSDLSFTTPRIQVDGVLFSLGCTISMTVNTTQDLTTGCPGTACSLRAALAVSPSGTTITFDPNVFNTPKKITLAHGPLYIVKSTTIQGPGPDLLTIDGNNAGGIFFVNYGLTAVISGMTMQHANMANSGSNPIESFANHLTIDNSVISSNFSPNGVSGILSSGSLTISNSTISNNTGAGGAISSSVGTLIISDSTISGNSASDQYGAGIYIASGTATISRSTISNNLATGPYSKGGGIYSVSGSLTVNNSTLTGNSAHDSGGGMDGSTVTISNSTLFKNHVTAGIGGGIHVSNLLNLGSSIVAGNTASGTGPDVAGLVNSLGYNLIGAADGVSGLVGTDRSGSIASPLDPLLKDLAPNGGPTWTMSLQNLSPAVNNGNCNLSAPAAPIQFDQRGALRKVPQCDIGAYESAAVFPTSTPTNTETSTSTATSTRTPTPSRTLTPSKTPTLTRTATSTRTPTSTRSSTPTRTSTRTATSTRTPTNTRTPTATRTPLPPGKVTLQAPKGTISTGQPLYIWTADLKATKYFLAVSGLNGKVIGNWYDSGAICSLTTCQIPPSVTLTNGPYSFWVETWNGTLYGPWSDGLSFSVTGQPLGDVVQLAPQQWSANPNPTFTWQPATNVQWYFLSVQDQTHRQVFGQWYGSSVCGSSVCSATPTLNLAAGKTYSWSLLPWGGGLTGPWSAGMTFTVGSPSATPTNTSTPSATATSTPTSTSTDTITPSVTASATPTSTPTMTVAVTPTDTVTPSVTSSATTTPTPTPTATVTDTATDTITPSVTTSATPTPTPTATVTPTYLMVTNALDDGSVGSLRYEIDNAPANTTLIFDTTVFNTNTPQTITLSSGTLTINQNLTIQGPGSSVVTVDGQNAVTVFTINSGTVNISGLTIQHGGTANLNGGGISTTSSSTVTVSDSLISNNSAFLGGGISNYGTLTVSNSTFDGNSADHGGGIFSTFPSMVTVSNSTFTGNQASGYYGGGAIYSGATLAVSSSTFSGNSALGVNAGGAIYNYYILTVSNSTISGNSGAGGGIYNDGGAATHLGSSIVAGNTGNSGPNLYANFTSLGSNVIGDATGSIGTWQSGSDQTGVANPMLDGLALNPPGTTQTMSLQVGSPAIGNGNCSTLAGIAPVTTDQRGVARKNPCDAGAYETTPVAPGAPMKQAPTFAPSAK